MTSTRWHEVALFTLLATLLAAGSALAVPAHASRATRAPAHGVLHHYANHRHASLHRTRGIPVTRLPEHRAPRPAHSAPAHRGTLPTSVRAYQGGRGARAHQPHAAGLMSATAVALAECRAVRALRATSPWAQDPVRSGRGPPRAGPRPALDEPSPCRFARAAHDRTPHSGAHAFAPSRFPLPSFTRPAPRRLLACRPKGTAERISHALRGDSPCSVPVASPFSRRSPSSAR